MTAARQAGAVLRRAFGRARVHVKFPGRRVNYRPDFVTSADLASERVILRILGRSRLRARFLSEEGRSEGQGSRFTWVVDPLDGTANFVSGIPYFAVSIALLEHSQPVAGIVFDPVHGELFSAIAGRGVLVNGKPTPRRGRRRSPMILFGLGSDRSEAGAALRTAGVLLSTRPTGLRMLGSAALDLAAVATGRADVFFHRWVNSWDIAAGVLLVREAGGTVLFPAARHGTRRLSSDLINLSRRRRDTILAYRPGVPAATVSRLVRALHG